MCGIYQYNLKKKDGKYLYEKPRLIQDIRRVLENLESLNPSFAQDLKIIRVR